LQESARATRLSPSQESKDIAISDLWLIARKRRVMLIVLAVGLAILGTVGDIVRGERYTGVGELQIQPGSASDLKQSISSALTGGEGGSLDVVVESDTEILTSDTLLSIVARDLKLQDQADFLGGKKVVKTAIFGGYSIPLLHGDFNNPYVHQEVIKILRKHLTIDRVPRTQMISLSYASPSAALSASIVNTLQSEFIRNNYDSHYENTKGVVTFLQNQIDDLRVLVQGSQDRMVDLQKKLGISALDPTHSQITTEVSGLEAGVSSAKEQRVLVESRYQILKSLPPDQIQDTPTALGTDGPTSLLANLRAQRASTVGELSRLQQVYGPNYPQVKQLNAQSHALDTEISKQEDRIINQAKDATEIAKNAENQATGMLDSKVNELYGKRDDIIKYELLQEEYGANRKMYDSIMARLREAAVDAGLDAAGISIVDTASIPVNPSSPPPALVGLVGFVLGVALGFAFAVFLEKLDTRLRDSDEIQRLLGLPSLAMIPETSWKEREAAGEQLVTPEFLRDPNSAFSEGFRVLRTSIQLSGTSRESKVIAVTSCQPGEGKSTVAANMAAALAQVGKRVLLVDTDMRRPSLFGRLGLTDKRGLSEVLTGLSTLEDVTKTHKVLTTLDLIPAGIRPPLPADLLGSPQMAEMLQQLRKHYDYVVLDTPPTLSVTDPAIVASQSDGVILVIRQGFCTRRMLQHVAQVFRGLDAKMYGFVFNGVDSSLPEYYGYLGYYSYDEKK
jgi:succinoglycan biosynthesis transport protein ExoP